MCCVGGDRVHGVMHCFVESVRSGTAEERSRECRRKCCTFQYCSGG